MPHTRGESLETLFIEPFSGMAGDMFLGALLSLGDARFQVSDLRALAEELAPGEARVDVEVVWRGSLSGSLVSVHTPESQRSPHRGLSECLARIAATSLTASAKKDAGAVLERIARAEARVHGAAIEDIHFHEVGAVDALIDVCGAVLGLQRLGVQRVLSLVPVTGSGTVRCAHGEMPVPAPGTAEILRGLPHVLGGGSGERLTPTGAALLAHFVERFGSPGLFETRAIGYGAGHRDPPDGPPNLVRVQLGRTPARDARPSRPEVWRMDVNLDDMSGEELGFLVRALRSAGALEVWTSAVDMKKDRPGTLVSLLCREAQRDALERVTLVHSTTLGLRWSRGERLECGRRSLAVTLLGREVRVVQRLRPGLRPGDPILESDLSPEYDDVEALALERGLAVREVERAAVEAALASLRERSDASAAGAAD